MIDRDGRPPFDRDGLGGARFDPVLHPELYEGVLSKRLVAFIVDAAIIVALLLPASLLVLVLGLLTLGIGWLLFGPLFAIVALGYVALTLGGPHSSTIGMRLAGIEMRMLTGGRMFPLLAAMHALLFWFSVTVLTPLILVVGLLSTRRRLLHDMVLNTVVVNAREFRRLP